MILILIRDRLEQEQEQELEREVPRAIEPAAAMAPKEKRARRLHTGRVLLRAISL